MHTVTKKALHTFIGSPVKSINIGLASFHEAVAAQGVDSVHLDWRPPAGGDRKIMTILDRLKAGEIAARIEQANTLAIERVIAGDPVLEDVALAGDVIPGMTDSTVLHAGPPIEWAQMSSAMQGSIIGALLYEGKANTPHEAMELAARGTLTFAPTNDHDAVGGMSGVITASIPVFVVRNTAFNTTGFSAWREIGHASGSYTPEVLNKMNWLKDSAMPAMRAALKARGGIELKPLLAQGLLMGDEHHNRVIADNAIFIKTMAPSLFRSAPDANAAAELLDYFAGFDLAVVPILMGACKAIMLAAEGIDASTIVTTWARNGYEDAIRISGLKGQWFAGPAPLVEGVYHSGFSQQDSAPVMGDSTIIECAGFGGFAIAAAPAHVTVRDTPGAAEQHTRDMYAITVAKNPGYPIAALGFQGVPAGIDLRKVVEMGILPISNNPAAHKDPEAYTGVIGFGVTRPSMDVFTNALTAFADTYCP